MSPATADWREAAMCQYTDPDLWFPDDNQRASPQAMALCRACPSRLPCLESALDSDEKGVWGGFTECVRRHDVRPAHNRGRPLEDIIADADAEFYARADMDARASREAAA